MKIIRAKEVKVGNCIYNSHAFHPAASWVQVTAVENVEGYVVLKTTAFDTWKNPLEGVAIQ